MSFLFASPQRVLFLTRSPMTDKAPKRSPGLRYLLGAHSNPGPLLVALPLLAENNTSAFASVWNNTLSIPNNWATN